MILHPTHYIRDIDPITLDLQSTEDKLELSHLDPRTGIAMSSRKELSLQSGNSRKGWAHVGEILWKIRPLVYGKRRHTRD